MGDLDDLDRELTEAGAPSAADVQTPPFEQYPNSRPFASYPEGVAPAEEERPERKIPEIMLQEAVQWALNRPRPEDPLEQEQVFAILYWYLPEERIYKEARERWGMGLTEIHPIVARPTFYNALGEGARLLMLKTYTRIMLAMSDRAERGSIPAANFVFEEMGLKREHMVSQDNADNLEKLVGKLILAVQDVLPKQEQAALGIVTTPGFVPNAVLPKAFHALPELQRRKVITKSGTYQRRRRRS